MTLPLPEALRQAMRRWASGVTVVSTLYQGQPYGMTVSSLTSVSLDPPYVLVSLARDAQTRQAVLEAGFFGVTILAEHQADLSERFAGQVEGPERFHGVETLTLVTGAPLLAEGLAYLDCRVAQTLEVGTHTLVIGAVQAARKGHAALPLVYFNRDYHRLAR
ncbi:MAG TPA: flavin reductase family protein [Anaerolineae bacterium]|nr:flavin reductase family protein [Anaerolineae bacterium]HID85168.1 flavin reductase [Anaerolineales bacterium]HIQ08089.1 flavin reductase [Anaerolineaceae bacterium]